MRWCAASGQSYEIEKRYRKPSGEYVWTLLTVGGRALGYR